jgi:hypothetical protein
MRSHFLQDSLKQLLPPLGRFDCNLACGHCFAHRLPGLAGIFFSYPDPRSSSGSFNNLLQPQVVIGARDAQ